MKEPMRYPDGKRAFRYKTYLKKWVELSRPLTEVGANMKAFDSKEMWMEFSFEGSTFQLSVRLIQKINAAIMEG